MPDGDVIPSAPVGLWKRPYDLMCSGATAETVADGVHHSLLTSIRDKGGLPGARDFASTVEALATHSLTLAEALAQLHEVEWRNGGHVHSRVAAEAVARLLVEVNQGMSLSVTPLRAIFERFCWGLIRYQFLGRIGPSQQGVVCTTYEGYLAWELQVSEPLLSQLGALASDLERDPTGQEATKLEWAVRKADPWWELSRMYPQLVETAAAIAGMGQDVSLVERQLVDLYRRYCDEWTRFRPRFAGVPVA